MKDKKFSPDKQSAFSARYEAQKIAFGPVVFQCVRYAWKRGVLHALAEAGDEGLSIGELLDWKASDKAVENNYSGLDAKEKDGNASAGWSAYALKVVLESCLSAGVVYIANEKYALDKAGYCFLSDGISQINFDFINDVCYLGLFDLDRSLDEKKPLGLRALGNWPTVYEGLSQLPEPARSSWFAFDHYYSDTSFPDILPDVFATAPARVMDVGANTGKFASAALAYNSSVELNLVDLPQQLDVADQNLRSAGLADRIKLHPVDMLQDNSAFPGGMDLVWMSQFLSCFSEEVIASILRRAASSLNPAGQLLILDTFWDRQRYDIASYCLINTSPYFSAIASGNSKVYESGDYIRLAESAGFHLQTIRDGIGYCHSLLRFTLSK